MLWLATSPTYQHLRTVRTVHRTKRPRYELRNIRGTNGPSMVRIVWGTNSPRYESPDTIGTDGTECYHTDAYNSHTTRNSSKTQTTDSFSKHSTFSLENQQHLFQRIRLTLMKNSPDVKHNVTMIKQVVEQQL